APAAPRSNPATRLSASISRTAPEAALVDRDSDSDAYPHLNAPSTQAIPEDFAHGPLLDHADQARSSLERTEWQSETPTAKEIWQNARRAWQKTSRHAVTWSGQGLRSAKKLAQNVNHKLQTRLDEAAHD